ncbi:lactonase family protein [Clostridium akagii]|uniref:lactonase family protein n=1 Tax=Clostridium akagii TaxID=91623 RepID=UPI00056884C5|nr:lactonase family protein [Clostridium akagii]
MESIKYIAYVGTYTYGDSKGIYKFTLNETEHKIEDINLAIAASFPTYLAISKNNKHLYSVVKDDDNGGLAAFEIDASNHELKPLNIKLTSGKSPCHVILNDENDYVFSANYHKAELISYPLSPDGNLLDASDKITHKGFGPNKLRQDAAHIHFVDFTPDKKYLYTIDLGLDKLSVYKFKDGKIKEDIDKGLYLKPGSGPRHMAFHPNGNFSYIITELSSEIITLEYNKITCSFKEIQYISSLPSDCLVQSGGGAVHLSSDGNFLYASNRGYDSITVFKIDTISGKLEFLCNTKLKGKSPRDFSLSPSGNSLLVVNQDSNNLELYSVDKTTGKLTDLNISEYIPNPVCIKFLD